MDHSDSGAIKSPTCMIPLLCAVCPKIPSDQWLSTQFSLLFDLIELFSIITGHAGCTRHALLVANWLSQKDIFHLANYSIWLVMSFFDFIFHIYNNTPMTNLVSLSPTGI